MTPDLFWIPGPWRGNLAVIARPRGGDWLEDEARAWQRAGIGVIVSLLEMGEAKEPDVAALNNIRFISFPIPDRGIPSLQENALSFLTAIASILEDGQNVAIHCRQSVGRSGLVAAGLLVRSGVDAAKAVETVSTARGIKIPETDGQLRWIKHLTSDNLVLT